MLNPDVCSIDEILMQRKSLRRKLSAAEGLQDIRIAVLGGSTTSEIVNLLELLLLFNGFRPTFHESEYGRYYEDSVLDPRALIDFKPDIVYLHTSCRNMQLSPPLNCMEADLPGYVEEELNRFKQIWNSLEAKLGCQVIQNNFEVPAFALLGNMDAASPGGLSRFLMLLNSGMAKAASTRPRVLIQDVHSISARFGLRHWFDWDRFASYKLLLTPEANLELARSLSSVIKALYGKSRKVLVLDLDNTLWGGGIGDDGLEGIVLGQGSGTGEAFAEFQQYAKRLGERGVVLAVCSKNDEANALEPFDRHPEMVLQREDVACFVANWNDKATNLRHIAKTLNLGLDALVFVDDSPSERALVRRELPMVSVPEMPEDPEAYVQTLAAAGYFEGLNVTEEDMQRGQLYQANAERERLKDSVTDMASYLESLRMVLSAQPIDRVALARATQLVNKTNQFNLTTERLCEAEMSARIESPEWVTLQVRLADRFGDNGVIAVLMARLQGSEAVIESWLMSCRVLGRRVEEACLNLLAGRCAALGATRLVGLYRPTAKNGMVRGMYGCLGFALAEETPQGEACWHMELRDFAPRAVPMQVELAGAAETAKSLAYSGV